MVAGGRKGAKRSESIRPRILFVGAGEEVGTDIIAGPVGRIPTG